MSDKKSGVSEILRSISEPSVKEKDKEVLFSELYSLLSSGLDFSRSFELLIAGEINDPLKKMLQKIYGDVVLGYPLHTAMALTNRFRALDCGVIRIGEETGKLSESLKFLSEYYHKKIEQHRMLISAIGYPIVILCTAVVVLTFMLVFIVPMFEQVYQRMGGELPAMTRMIVSFSAAFPKYCAITSILLLIGVFLLYTFRENDSVRSAKSSLLLSIPVSGKIVKKNQQAHFCKLLYLLTGSGVSLLYGIEMLKEIITFYPYQRSFEDICLGLNRGELFSDTIAKFPKLYSHKLCTLLRVGEETNRLPEMLHKQGEDLTKELEYHLKQLGDFLEPLLILIIGTMVAVILISMYLPMFKLGGVMQ